MENFMTCASGVGWRIKRAHVKPSASNKTAATAQASHDGPSKRDRLAISCAAGKVACVSSREPDGADNASSAKPRSCAERSEERRVGKEGGAAEDAAVTLDSVAAVLEPQPA